VARLEGKVLELVAAGNSYRAIASKLNLSKVTVNQIVKEHRQVGAV
jgi:DNA-binding NarL/FixJ family response regulator